LNTNPKKRAQLIFEAWKTSLVNRDRSSSALLENFDDLFYEMYSSSIDLELAHDYLSLAVQAHLPSKQTLKYIHKKVKTLPGRAELSEQDFFESWKQLIEQAANQAFYARFPILSPEKPKEPTESKQDAYRKLREYADSFPIM